MTESNRSTMQTLFGSFAVAPSTDGRLFKMTHEAFVECQKFGLITTPAATPDAMRTAVLAVITAASPVSTSTAPAMVQLLARIFHIVQRCGQVTQPLG